jgi:hypothetical protein
MTAKVLYASDGDRVICYGEPPTGLMHEISISDAIRRKIIVDKLCWSQEDVPLRDVQRLTSEQMSEDSQEEDPVGLDIERSLNGRGRN